MAHPYNAIIDNELRTFANSVPPPPPYSATGGDQYDLTPTSQLGNRPRLPEDRRNTHLIDLPEDATLVKFQTIVREGKEIVVGRLKVTMPGTQQHAFILRRYDTDSISLTTMYKVAFPGASDADERRELDWIKSSFDTRNTNGGRNCDEVRLAGQWISRHLAIHLAPAYHIEKLVAALARAVPDPNVAYRKSQRSIAAAATLQQASGAAAPAPAPKRVRTDAEDTRHLTLEATTTVTAPAGATIDMEAEIESAKQLVMNLKRELRLRTAAGEALEEQGYDVAEGSRGQKRGQGDDIVEISGGVGKERIVRRSQRVEQKAMGPATKVAWGTLIFSLGVGFSTVVAQYL